MFITSAQVVYFSSFANSLVPTLFIFVIEVNLLLFLFLILSSNLRTTFRIICLEKKFQL